MSAKRNHWRTRVKSAQLHPDRVVVECSPVEKIDDASADPPPSLVIVLPVLPKTKRR